MPRYTREQGVLSALDRRRFCHTCHHCDDGTIGWGQVLHQDEWKCMNPRLHDVVAGDYGREDGSWPRSLLRYNETDRTCRKQRAQKSCDMFCGTEGRWWEPKIEEPNA